MTDKLLKITDSVTLLLLGFLTAASLLFPVFSNPDLGIIYKSCIVLAGIFFVLSNKLLQEELKIETPIDINLILLFFWYLISALVGRNMFSAFNSAMTFTVFLLFFYITYNYAKKYFSYFLFFLIVVVSLMSIYGLYQYFSGFSETLKYLLHNQVPDIEAIKQRIYSKRIFSTLVYPNTFAGLLIMIIPVLIALIKSEKKYRSYLIASLLLMLSNLVLTRSVGAFICLIAASFIMLLFVSDPGLKNFRRIFFLFTIIAAGLLAFIVYLRGLNTLLPEINLKVESWLRIIDIIKHNPIFGSGPGSFESTYNDPLFGKAGFLKYGHNFILQVTMETGLIGLSLLVFTGYTAYNSIIRNFYFLRTPNKKILVFSMLTGLTAFLLHNLVDFDIYNFEITIVFLVLLATLMSQVNIGLIQLKKIKLSYLLGINPGRRRSIIFYAILLVLLLCAVTGGKQIYFYTIINVLITAGFAIWSISKEDIRRTSIDIPLILFLLWCGISLFITPNIYAGVKIYTLLVSATVLYYLSSQFLRNLNFRATIANFLISIGTLLAVVACAQYLYNYTNKLPLYTDGFFPNPSLFSAYMSISFAFLLSRLLLEKNIRLPLTKIAALILIIFTSALSASKSGMLTLIIVFIGITIYYLKYSGFVKDTPSQTSLKKWFLRIVFIILIAAAFTPLTPAGEKMSKINADPFYFNRLDIYKATYKMGVASPVFGWGLGSFESIFPSFNFPVKSVARYQMTTAFAHNEYLQIFATAGIPGLIIIGFFIFFLMKKIPVYEGHKKLWSIKTAAYFAIVGILFHSFFYFTLHLPGILLTCAVLASFIAEERYSIRTVSREALLFTKIYYLPALLLSFILFFIAIRPAAAYFLNTKYLQHGNIDLIYDASLLDPLDSLYPFEKGLFYEKSGDLRTSIPYFERAFKLDRKNYIYSLHAGRANVGIGDYEEALKYYNFAISSNPYRVFSYSELAGFYYNYLNNDTKAEYNLQKAIEIEPYFLEGMNNLAAIYISQKKYESALLEYDKMEEIIHTEIATNDYEKEILGVSYFTVLQGKAITYLKNGKKSMACTEYQKALVLGGVNTRNSELENNCRKANHK